MQPWLREACDIAQGTTHSPARLFLPHAAAERFAEISALAVELSTSDLTLQPCYSVKTNPRGELLAAARAHAFLAETISSEEVEAARRSGFASGAIVRNGPLPESKAGESRLHARFADSLEALVLLAREPDARITGVRIRPPGIVSRFGLERHERAAAAALFRHLPADVEPGLSFHVRPEDYAGRTWLELVDGLLEAAVAFGSGAGRPVRCLDVGGGWVADALDRALRHEMPVALARVRSVAPDVREVLFEPGQSLAAGSEALLATVVEVRPARGEVVLDAGVNWLPQRAAYRHRAYWLRDGEPEPVEPGSARALGPLCLEYDVPLPGIRLPGDVRPGTRVLVADCGAYDASMAFAFGTGLTADGTLGT